METTWRARTRFIQRAYPGPRSGCGHFCNGTVAAPWGEPLYRSSRAYMAKYGRLTGAIRQTLLLEPQMERCFAPSPCPGRALLQA